ncbi:hypothetical protein D1920_09855 [Rhodopseudomonas palustris]|nr:hypothetical protein D1920_09855 [Rhodopseudomonas palustris]
MLRRESHPSPLRGGAAERSGGRGGGAPGTEQGARPHPTGLTAGHPPRKGEGCFGERFVTPAARGPFRSGL